MQQPDIAVAGGGIIGLATALELRRHGARVTVLDDAKPGFASIAAAGMLAAHDPENPPELRALSERSLALYPDFLRRASTFADDEVPFETSFTLQLTKHSVSTGRSVSPTELKQLLPSLEPLAGYHLLTEHSLDPRRLHSLLVRAAAAAGVRQLNATLQSITESATEVTLALANGDRTTAEHLIDCRGAWMPTIRPRKGQLVRAKLHGELTNHAMGNIVLRTPDIYIVPRLDGTAVIGATVEDCGYDTSTSQDATSTLIAQAASILPAVSAATITETWSGLRPCTADGLPTIGQVASRIIVAGGHFRNGILLAPVTAEAVADILRGAKPHVPPDHFLPDAEAYRLAAITAQP